MSLHTLIKEEMERFEKEFPNLSEIHHDILGDCDIRVKSFIKSSHIALIESMIEMLEGMLVNTPAQVAELNKHLPSTLQEQSYSEAVGYTKAINQAISYLQSEKEFINKIK